MSEQPDPLSQMLKAYRNAVFAKSVDGFVALYDDDVHIFDMWGVRSLRGIDTWRGAVVDWFSSLGDERVIVDFAEPQITVLGELAVGHAVLTCTAVAPEGRALRSLSNRITLGLKRSGGVWKIFHEHTSAPIDHQSLKAMLHPAGGSDAERAAG